MGAGRGFARDGTGVTKTDKDGGGYVGKEKAASVAAEVPESAHSVDVVDMLGELRAPEAVGTISRILWEKRESDAPFFAVCTKMKWPRAHGPSL